MDGLQRRDKNSLRCDFTIRCGFLYHPLQGSNGEISGLRERDDLLGVRNQNQIQENANKGQKQEGKENNDR